MAEINNTANTNVSQNLETGQQMIDLSGLDKNNADLSLDEIAGKYTDIGNQVGKIASQAAENVGWRQQQLIGNDFGATNPYMYDTYYEQTPNSFKSAMRVQGTNEALAEGMDRGKAAAEANLNNAKSNYQSAQDAYANAKEAYKNMRVAMLNSSLLPEGTTNQEMINFNNIGDMASKEDAQRQYAQQYVDSQDVDWSDQEQWANSVQDTLRACGISDEQYNSWSDEDRQRFWDSNEATVAFNKDYQADWIGKHYGEEAKAKYEQSYNDVINLIDEVFDFTHNLTDSLPDFDNVTLFKVDNSKIQKIEAPETPESLADDKTKYTQEWIDANVPEDDKKQITDLYNKTKANEEAIMSGVAAGTLQMDINSALAAVWSQYLGTVKTYDTGITEEEKDKIKSNFELKDADVKTDTSSMLENIFGFDMMDLMWLDRWRDRFPDDFNAYKQQLAQAYGLTNTIEVADGEKSYWTENGYEVLPKGTPVFFTYDGAMNADGSFKDKELEKFVKAWDDYYSADVNAISDEELSNKQDALNETYTEYMKNVALGQTFENMMGGKLTANVYSAILACREGVASSEYEVNGKKIKDIIADFKKTASSNADLAYKQFLQIANKAMEGSTSFYRYSPEAQAIVNESKTFDSGSVEGEDKLGQSVQVNNRDKIDDPGFGDITKDEAEAMYLTLLQSMEDFNAGKTDSNIDPVFMKDSDLKVGFFDTIGNAFAGTLELVGSAFSFLGGLFDVAGMINGDWNPTDDNFLGLEGTNANNVWGSLFTGNQELNYDNSLERGRYSTGLENVQRQMAQSLFNPLMVAAVVDGKDYSEIRGVGDAFSTEGRSLFNNPNPTVFLRTAYNFAGVAAEIFAEGAAASLAGKGITKTAQALASTRLANKINLAVTLKTATWMKKNEIARNLLNTNYADDIVRTAANNTAVMREGAEITTEVAGKTVASFNATTNEFSKITVPAGKIISAGDDSTKMLRVADMMGDTSKGTAGAADTMRLAKMTGVEAGQVVEKFGATTSNMAHAMSLLDSTDLAMALKNYGSFGDVIESVMTKSGILTDAANKVKIVLQDGTEVSLAKATAVCAANKVNSLVTISQVTGISADIIATLPSGAQKVLMKAINLATDTGELASKTRSINKFMSSMSADDIAELAKAMLTRVASGKNAGKWTSFDTLRSMAEIGWDAAGKRQLMNEFIKDALTDPIRDFKRNVTSPQLGTDGEFHVQTIGEYFTDPVNIGQNLLFSGAHFGLSRVKTQLGARHYHTKSLEAWNAVNASGDVTSEAAQKAVKRAEALTQKAQEYSEKAWTQGMSYNKVVKYTDLSEAKIDASMREIFANNGWDLEYGKIKEHFNTQEEFLEYIEKKVPADEALFNISNSLGLRAANCYYLNRMKMGTEPGELGAAPSSVRVKILRTISDTFDANHDAVKAKKGTVIEKYKEMQRLAKAAVLDANSKGQYGMKVQNLEKSMDGMFQFLMNYAERGIKDGTLKDLRIDYFPIHSMIFNGSFDEMKASHYDPVMRGLMLEGENINVAAANPADVRSLEFRDIVKGLENGDQTIELKDVNGNVLKSYLLDVDGTDFTDMLTVYNNNYNIHKYLDPLMGDNRVDFGKAGMRNGNIFFNSKDVLTMKYRDDLAKAQERAFKSNEYVIEKAFNEGKITKKQADLLKKQGYAEFIVNRDVATKLNNVSANLKQAEAKMNSAKRVFDNVDQPSYVYSSMATAFGLEVNGKPDVAGGQKLWDNGQKIADNLYKDYMNGKFSDANIGERYTIKTQFNGKAYNKDITLTQSIVDDIDYAAKNNGKLTSDLIVEVAVENDINSPYIKKVKNDAGTYDYEYVGGYKSSIMNAYGDATNKIEITDGSDNNVVARQKDFAKSEAKKAMDEFKQKKIVFGATDRVDARTGKTTKTGIEVDAGKLYSQRFAIGEVEGMDDSGMVTYDNGYSTKITTNTQELEDLTRAQIYSKLGANYKSGKWQPNAQQERYADLLISRAKVEIADMGETFGANDWFNAIDARAGDLDCMKELFSSFEGRNSNLFSVLSGIENDGTYRVFKDELLNTYNEVLAGKYDNMLPDGMTREQFAAKIDHTYELLDAADNYAYRAKAEGKQQAVMNDEGEDLDIQEKYNLETNESESEIFFGMSGREINMDKANILNWIKDAKEVFAIYNNPNEKLHKAIKTDSLEAANNARIETRNFVNGFKDKLIARAENLYKSNKNPEFNNIVDKAKADWDARAKFEKQDAKGYFLEALGIAPKNMELNSISGGVKYNAAKLAEATGIEDASVAGWSKEITDMRLKAGTYGGQMEQLMNGMEIYKMFALDETSAIDDGIAKLKAARESLDERLVAIRPDSMDNVENSVTSMMADVYNDKMAIADTKSTLEYKNAQLRNKYKNGEINLNDFTKASYDQLESIISAAKQLPALEQQIRLVEQYKYTGQEQDLADLYAQYSSVKENIGLDDARIAKLQKYGDDILSYKENYDKLANSKLILSDSEAKGKASFFEQDQLGYTAFTTQGKNHNIADTSFTVGKKSDKFEYEFDYGSGTELSETAVGLRIIKPDGRELNLSKLPTAEKEEFMKALSVKLDENDSEITVVKRSSAKASKRSVDNPNYDWTKGGKQFDDNGKEITPYVETGKSMSIMDGDILKDFGDDWVLISKPKDTFVKDIEQFARGTSKIELTPEEAKNRAMMSYASATKDYSPAKEIDKASSDYKKFKAEYDKYSKEAETLRNQVKKESLSVEDLAKKTLDENQYNRYKSSTADYERLKGLDEKTLTSYDALGTGARYVADMNLPAGYTTAKALIDSYLPKGYDIQKVIDYAKEGKEFTKEELKAERKAHSKMQKEINKNASEGHNPLHKTAKEFEVKASDMDLASRAMTLNNLLKMVKQVGEEVGFDKITDENLGSIVVNKGYADLLARVSRDGLPNNKGLTGKLKEIAFEVSDWNKFIQEQQMAGGGSWINALSIAQLRGAIFSDPLKMKQYLEVCGSFKNSGAAAKFAIENSEFLVEMGMKTGDTSVFTDLKGAVGARPGLEDGGTLQATATRVREAFKNRKGAERSAGEKYEFSKASIENATDSLFGSATFQNMLPVLRAKMLRLNYDEAVKSLTRKFKGAAEEDIHNAAIAASYAKTTAYFEPNKTSAGLFKNANINKVMDNIHNEKLHKVVASYVGAKDTVTIGQAATNCFFAMGYKTSMAQRVFQGAKEFINPASIAQRLKNFGSKESFTGMDFENNLDLQRWGNAFMTSGNMKQVASLAGMAVIAKISADALGLPTAWDDMNWVDEKDGEFKVPDILQKFQTIGQIWIPNAVDENGNLIIDPTKTFYGIDTMSSIFTLPNTFWKAVDRTANPNAYYSAPQRGIGLHAGGPVNDFLNAPFMRAIGDEVIGANLLSPYKAMYEVLIDSTYYGNNIWEKKYLPDGSENPNYDPARNITASVFHILGFDQLLDGKGYNSWVKGKGTDKYVAQDQIGTVAGSGIFQHEYATALINFLNDETLDGVIEAGELPIKKQNLSSKARTEFNTEVKNIISQYMSEYKNKIKTLHNNDEIDELYASTVKKCADVVATWSAKHEFALGKNQQLVASTTRTLMAVLAGEYDDNMDYVQNAYWKASQLAQIESTGGADYWLGDADLDRFIAEGKTADDFAAEKNRRTDAYNQAMDDEYRARKALKDAKFSNEYIEGFQYENLRSEQRAVNKKIYEGIMSKMEGKVGDFNNYKELKTFYEEQIDAATTTKKKAELAEQYNNYVKDAVAPFVNKYGASIITDVRHDRNYLSKSLSDYIIIPADKYYRGKSPQTSYLKDFFGVGYRDSSNIPSDDEVIEAYANAKSQLVKGHNASASAMLSNLIDSIKKGRVYVSDSDYSKIINMKAQLSARSK